MPEAKSQLAAIMPACQVGIPAYRFGRFTDLSAGRRQPPPPSAEEVVYGLPSQQSSFCARARLWPCSVTEAESFLLWRKRPETGVSMFMETKDFESIIPELFNYSELCLNDN